ncbi:MAG: flagellar protein FliS [Candidatus Eremiobacterota bacterium]
MSLELYRSVQATTANPGQLLMLLLDGTLRETQKARQAFLEGPSGGETCLMKACLGVSELDRTLNHGPLPELAEALHRLYLHLLTLLGDAMTARDPEPLGRAERILAELRDTWREALSQSAPVRMAG